MSHISSKKKKIAKKKKRCPIRPNPLSFSKSIGPKNITLGPPGLRFFAHFSVSETSEGVEVCVIKFIIISTEEHTPVLQCPQIEIVFWSFSCLKIETWKHHRCIFCTVFRNSALTPARQLIPKCATLRWTLWCSHYSVSKWQQFS